MQLHRHYSIVIGALFLLPFFAHGFGSYFIAAVAGGLYTPGAPADRMLYTGGILLVLDCIAIAALGILLHPLLRTLSKCIALSYLCARSFEAVVLAISPLSVLSQSMIGRSLTAPSPASHFQALVTTTEAFYYYGYPLAMAALAISSLGLCYLLWRFHLVPVVIPAVGISMYLLLLAGLLFEWFGQDIGSYLVIPSSLFEVALGTWLIIKGFAPASGARAIATPVSGQTPR
ncbi:protein of unknown function [Parapedobacter composti]|uniref:DUF4386 domain-containing protein n=1 Tax=Parapedobacter composti TaxID=623281 RepID=A0A1I1G9H3_9SPHI|nr:DUF4386 domain-containing protein [Parapedobacter composti]SFC08214.1 protein of unknown function [Parapedobacter composti]